MFEVVVSKILECENLHCINFTLQNFGCEFSLICLEIPQNLKINSRICVGFKPFSTLLSKEILPPNSFSNFLKVVIKKINIGEILTKLQLQYLEISFDVVVLSNFAKELNLGVNDEIFAYFNPTSLYIEKVL